MKEIIWNIPNPERIIARMEELRDAINNLPQSPLVDIWKRELEKLQVIPI